VVAGQPSFLERNRILIIGGLVAVAIGVVGLLLIQGATASPYVCDSLLTPGPVASAEGPSATPRLGFVTEDMGRDHVGSGSTTRHGFCPPTSGEHWNIAGRAPLPRAFYEPSASVSPGNWIHNLEHGYVVIAYRGAPSAVVLAGIRSAFQEAAPSDFAQEQCGLPNKVIVVRFDDMAEPFALLAWDRALLLPEWDTDAAIAFAEQWQDSPQAPETLC
jgi:hypothetical protein